MTVTSGIFEAFQKCPTKCYLRSHGEVGTENAYANWARTQNESYRKEGIKRLTTGAALGQCAIDSVGTKNLKKAEWRLATDYVVRAQSFETCLHAMERIPPEACGKPTQFVPTRFIAANKIDRDDKLLLAFDALVFSEVLGREVGIGKIVHGDDYTKLEVKTSVLKNEVRKLTEKIVALLSSHSPPDLVLNRHCVECEFRDRLPTKGGRERRSQPFVGHNGKGTEELEQKRHFYRKPTLLYIPTPSKTQAARWKP